MYGLNTNTMHIIFVIKAKLCLYMSSIQQFNGANKAYKTAFTNKSAIKHDLCNKCIIQKHVNVINVNKEVRLPFLAAISKCYMY